MANDRLRMLPEDDPTAIKFEDKISAERIIFFLGRMVVDDFGGILMLSGNGYGFGAYKVARDMYERARRCAEPSQVRETGRPQAKGAHRARRYPAPFLLAGDPQKTSQVVGKLSGSTPKWREKTYLLQALLAKARNSNKLSDVTDRSRHNAVNRERIWCTPAALSNREVSPSCAQSTIARFCAIDRLRTVGRLLAF
jgi:hypothetical protein